MRYDPKDLKPGEEVRLVDCGSCEIIELFNPYRIVAHRSWKKDAEFLAW